MISKELAMKLKDAGFPESGFGFKIDGYYIPTIGDLLKEMPGYKLSYTEHKDDEWIWQVWNPNFRLVFVDIDPDSALAQWWIVKKEREECKRRSNTLTM